MKKQLLAKCILILSTAYFAPVFAQDAGHTAGEFSVSPKGTSMYNVPIGVPPGIGQVAPALALSYNGDIGNGLASRGWTISGLSEISRVPATKYYDGFMDPVNYDLKDRYALDGQRLILTKGTYGKAGSEYATEMHSNIKVVAHGTNAIGNNYGPAHFIVYHPNGTRVRYENIVSGRKEAKHALQWVATNSQDALGNRINYEYQAASAQNMLRLKRVLYGGNVDSRTGVNQIDFVYDKNRTTSLDGFFRGSTMVETKLLSRIAVKANSKLYRAYTLTYGTTNNGYDYLASVTESNGQNKSLRPIKFTYDLANEEYKSEVREDLKLSSEIKTGERVLMGDLDGDGENDIVKVNEDKSQLSLLLEANSFGSPKNLELPGSYSNFKDITITSVNNTSAWGDTKQFIVTLSLAKKGANDVFQLTYYGLDGSGTFKRLHNQMFTNDQNTSLERRLVGGDFNGDGNTDLVILTDKSKYVRYLDDLSFLDGNAKTLRTVGSLDYEYTIGSDTDGALGTGDFNGDGQSDIAHITQGVMTCYEIDEKDKLKKFVVKSLNHTRTAKYALFGDFNGDGLGDFIIPNTVRLSADSPVLDTAWTLYKSNGVNDFQKIGGVVGPNMSGNLKESKTAFFRYTYYVSDFDKDGKTDIIRLEGKLKGSKKNRYTRLTTTFYRFDYRNPNRPSFKKVFNGFSVNVKGDPTGAYAAMFLNTDKNFNDEFSIYLKDKIYSTALLKNTSQSLTLSGAKNEGNGLNTYVNGIANPRTTRELGFNASSNLVQLKNYGNTSRIIFSIRQTSPSGLRRFMAFRYENPVAHTEGLGFMGYESVKSTNWYDGDTDIIWSETKYTFLGPNNMPTGVPKVRKIFADDGSAISETNYTYLQKNLANKIRLIKPVKIITTDKLNRFKKEEKRKYTAPYYNLVRLEIANFDGSAKKGTQINETTFENRIGDEIYFVGRTKRVSVLRQITGSSALRSITDFKYHSGKKHQLVKEKAVKSYNGKENKTESFQYDDFGNVDKMTFSGTGIADRTDTYKYKNGRFMTEHTDYMGRKTTYTYDFLTGNPVKSKDFLGRETRNTYDGWGRALSETDVFGKRTTFVYSTQSNLLKKMLEKPDGAKAYTLENSRGLIVEEGSLNFEDKWLVIKRTFDSVGRELSVSEPCFGGSGCKINTTEYDRYGRIRKVVAFNGKTVTTTYGEGQVHTNDGVIGRTVHTDPNGNEYMITDNSNTNIRQSYHSNGTLKDVSRNGKRMTTIQIDKWGRKKKMVDVSAGTFEYKYNILGDVLEEKTPLNGKFTYKYDKYGRMVNKKITGQNTKVDENYQYHKRLFEVTRITSKNGNQLFNYTNTYYEGGRNIGLPQEIKETINGKAEFTKKLVYDSFGRIERYSIRSKFLLTGDESSYNITNTYKNGHSVRLSNAGGDKKNYWKLEKQNARGEMLQAKLGNGFTMSQKFDGNGFLREINDYKEDGNAKSTALNALYRFGAKQNRLLERSYLNGRDKLSYKETFGYDGMSRLTTINKKKDFDYFNSGQRKKHRGIGATFAYDYKGHLSNIQLDDRGKAVFEGFKQRKLTYSVHKLPKEIDVRQEQNEKLSFEYNGDMKRAIAYYGGSKPKPTERRFRKYYSSIVPSEITQDVKNKSVKLVTYLDGDAYTASIVGIKEKQSEKYLRNGVHYLHRDYLGSILAISDSKGKVVEQRRFGAWGDVTTFAGENGETDFSRSAILDRGYTGHEHLFEAGLIHMNARLYDPLLGQFLSPDNFVQDTGNTQNYNRYGYAYNNPLMYSDPTGDFFFLAGALLFAKTFGIVGFGAAVLTGAALSIDFNGFMNLANGQPYLKGAIQAGVIGGVTGGLTFGIAGVGGASFGDSVARHFLHGVVSGAESVFNGGEFGSAFLSGFVGHSVGGLVNSKIKGGGLYSRIARTVASGSLAGGITSGLTGGSVIMGIKQGFRTSLLNASSAEIMQILESFSQNMDVRESDYWTPGTQLSREEAERLMTNPDKKRIGLVYTLYNPKTNVYYVGMASSNKGLNVKQVLSGRMRGKDHQLKFKNGFRLNSVEMVVTGRFSRHYAQMVEDRYIVGMTANGRRLANVIKSPGAKRFMRTKTRRSRSLRMQAFNSLCGAIRNGRPCY